MITPEDLAELKNAYDKDYADLPFCDWWKVEHLYKYARQESCVKTCEIGVFHGKSFLALAYAAKHNKKDGLAIGIDPWETDAAMQVLPDALKSINKEVAEYDFEDIYQCVISKLDKYDLSKHCKILRAKSQDVVHTDPDISDIDLLHIDGNHGEEAVMNDFKNYFEKVKPGGIVWFDDYYPIWTTIIPTVEYAKERCTLLEETHNQAIFRKE